MNSSRHDEPQVPEVAGEITRLLQPLVADAGISYEELIPLVYRELRRISGHLLRKERSDIDMQPTELVNEAYLRLRCLHKVKWQNRVHFFAMSARVMRRVLVEHARAQRASKRGGGAQNLPLDEVVSASIRDPGRMLELDEVLERLERLDARQAAIVELRFFAGLTEQEIAEVMQISVATVKNDWRSARAWLLSKLASRS